MSKIYVIEITKKYRNGKDKKVLVIEADDEEDIDYQVQEWCESDSSGAVYGWTATYDIVEDKEVIRKAFEEKIQGISDGIERLTRKLYHYKEEFEKLGN